MAKTSSSGHKLGQIIGDWYEEYFALPILQDVANDLGLFLDNRFIKRECRGDKIIWQDVDGNDVDYDFVTELGGSHQKKGALVAAFETFWRRGSRHSKDKARDDTGKLLPLKATYPTARAIGIIAAGDFTAPAKDLVKSRGVDLFYVDKANILLAWEQNGLQVDYPDKSDESTKSKITNEVMRKIKRNPEILKTIAHDLINLINPATIKAYQNRLLGIIGAMPQSYYIQIQSKSNPIMFKNYSDVDNFLFRSEPKINDYHVSQYYTYQVLFFDGDEFFRDNLRWVELKEIHLELKELVKKFEKQP